MSGPAGPAPPPGPGPGLGPAPGPDLSHLTEEEQSIILSVVERQKKEEEEEQSMLKKLHQQFEMYKDQVKKLGEEPQAAQTARAESLTCGVCRQTKMADGCGRACCYCQSRFCARCGGAVPLRANKVMWVCNVCRRKQEILTQSGEFHSNTTSHGVPQPPVQGLPEGTRPLSNGDTDRVHVRNQQDNVWKLPSERVDVLMRFLTRDVKLEEHKHLRMKKRSRTRRRRRRPLGNTRRFQIFW
ncbi:unnamed protein product [Pleuronectes platessa]|uniref:Uncharacterized protein n=1 Tax=Pleuronectes platessa TaxID=8262 RepID=A0A9N7YL90_PLEPL|nr:unnamed protein product [Pleuronectes platessa]